jgi:hypothetical protein
MYWTRSLTIALLLIVLSIHSGAAKGVESANDITARALLWTIPEDIASRDLFYGRGGHKNKPHGFYVFLKEDLNGTNPKFDVRDGNGIEWKVKLGLEAKPEIAASRLVWAVGYITSEDYYLPTIRVENMPLHLHRGQEMVSPDGSIADVRLKRFPDHMKKLGTWQWSGNPFAGTREFNELRVMMALINNWDLKDSNTAILKPDHTGNGTV